MREEIHLVQDARNDKPFWVVKLIFGENHYVGHEIIRRYKTPKSAELRYKKEKSKLNIKGG